MKTVASVYSYTLLIQIIYPTVHSQLDTRQLNLYNVHQKAIHFILNFYLWSEYTKFNMQRKILEKNDRKGKICCKYLLVCFESSNMFIYLVMCGQKLQSLNNLNTLYVYSCCLYIILINTIKMILQIVFQKYSFIYLNSNFNFSSLLKT